MGKRATSSVAFLLGLNEPDVARKVGRRLAIVARRDDVSPMQVVGQLTMNRLPMSAVLWLLERDDPEINKAVYHQMAVPNANRRDILRGVPFGPGVRGRIRVSHHLSHLTAPDVPVVGDPRGPVAVLRRVRTMRQGYAAANRVSRADWDRIAAADQEEPLPGYARWALAVRIDCPDEVRAQFGTHPKFTHRLWRAGIVSGPREYVERWRPAGKVLNVLDLGRAVFPARVQEAAEVLRPLVRSELGGHVGAWQALVRLLPSFDGTLPELITAAGAAA